MNCKHCGVAIHKCSSADEYHADDKMEYIKELDGSGCIHEPETRPTQLAADGGSVCPRCKINSVYDGCCIQCMLPAATAKA